MLYTRPCLRERHALLYYTALILPDMLYASNASSAGLSAGRAIVDLPLGTWSPPRTIYYYYNIVLINCPGNGANSRSTQSVGGHITTHSKWPGGPFTIL